MKYRKYRLLFSPKRHVKPGPKGPGKDLMEAVVQMKQRNPTWGCPRIAQQIALAFGIEVNKDMVRRILAAHYRPIFPRLLLSLKYGRLDELVALGMVTRKSCTALAWIKPAKAHALQLDSKFERESLGPDAWPFYGTANQPMDSNSQK